jgi:hypothetical protein
MPKMKEGMRKKRLENRISKTTKKDSERLFPFAFSHTD